MADFVRNDNLGLNILILDDKEAGLLKDLLLAHVGGRLTLTGEPLGRIREALAPVSRHLARKSSRYGTHGYAVIEEYPDMEDMLWAKKLLADDIGRDAVEGRE